jgi:carbon-monoxide dehydrogenase medium subunit
MQISEKPIRLHCVLQALKHLIFKLTLTKHNTKGRTIMPHSGEVRFADSVHEAAAMIAADPGLIPLAGATWTMRAGLRHEALPERYLALTRIAALREIAINDSDISIGAMATHAQIAGALVGDASLRGLSMAAAISANPGIRRLATLGGNICAAGFAAGDLVPALLALDASVEIMRDGQAQILPLAAFLRMTSAQSLLVRAVIPHAPGTGAHARLTMRAAGDYPIAIASVWMSDDAQTLRIAIGAVEDAPRRWTALEQVLTGEQPDAARTEALAKTHLRGITGRDAVDAKGAYRLRVLPHLVGRAMADLAAQQAGSAA